MAALTSLSPAPSVSRRAVARGLAWTVPAVTMASAAPAFSASCSAPAPFTGKFSQPNVYGTPPLTYTWTAVGRTPITLTLSTVSYSGKTLAANNLTSAGGIDQGYSGIGDLRTDGLQLQQSGDGGQLLTIAFSRPVTDLKFTIADIDWQPTNQYRDSIILSPAPNAVTNGSAVQGIGTGGSPLTAKAPGVVNSDVVANRSTVTYAGPVSSFTLDFSSTAGKVAQQIFLTGLTFTAC